MYFSVLSVYDALKYNNNNTNDNDNNNINNNNVQLYNQQLLIIVAALFYSKYSIQAANDSASIEYIWDPSYFIVSVLSPILLLLMMLMGVWLIICFCKEQWRSCYICIHFLAVAVRQNHDIIIMYINCV